jgi:hypothetical protein
MALALEHRMQDKNRRSGCDDATLVRESEVGR